MKGIRSGRFGFVIGYYICHGNRNTRVRSAIFRDILLGALNSIADVIALYVFTPFWGAWARRHSVGRSNGYQSYTAKQYGKPTEQLRNPIPKKSVGLTNKEPYYSECYTQPKTNLRNAIPE
jgi:hypothetical protein